MNKKNILFLALAALSMSSAVFGMEKKERPLGQSECGRYRVGTRLKDIEREIEAIKDTIKSYKKDKVGQFSNKEMMEIALRRLESYEDWKSLWDNNKYKKFVSSEIERYEKAIDSYKYDRNNPRQMDLDTMKKELKELEEQLKEIIEEEKK